MTYKIILLRLGRIYKPKYDIILYHNWRRIVKFGTIHPLNEFVLGGSKLKIINLNIELMRVWLVKGIIFPKWLLTRYNILYSAHRFYSGQVYSSKKLHLNLVVGETIFNENLKSYSKNTNKNSPNQKFFKGKYLVRNWIRQVRKKKFNEKKTNISYT